MNGHQDYSVGDFYTDGSTLKKTAQGYTLEQKVWLVPFDLGVSQMMKIITAPDTNMKVEIHRTDGDISAWKRTNERFMKILQKEISRWEKLSVKKKQQYKKETEIAA